MRYMPPRTQPYLSKEPFGLRLFFLSGRVLKGNRCSGTRVSNTVEREVDDLRVRGLLDIEKAR